MRRNAGGVSRDSAPARECRPGGWHPFRPQRYRRAVGPGRTEPQAVLPPIFLDAPVLVEVSGAAGERIGVKNPSRAGSAVEDDVRTRIPSAPAPLRHRDSAHEGPPSRSSTARVVLPYPIPPTGLGGVRSSERRPASPPPTRKTSDLPPGIGISIGPPILTSTKQQISKTTKRHNNKTAQLEIRRS